MRGFVDLAVRRRVSVLMTSLAVAAFGIVGYQRLALELFPDITYPSLTVQTDLADAAPQEVENLVTRPVEEAVGVLRGLETIHSVSRPGVSEVTLEFDWRPGWSSAMDVPDLGPGLTWAFDAGLLAHVDHRLVLTSRGRLLSNEVFARLLPERPTGVASVGTGP